MAGEAKTALTYKEAIKSAYLCDVLGVRQQDCAVAFEVNHGRVNEALQAVRSALGAYEGAPKP